MARIGVFLLAVVVLGGTGWGWTRHQERLGAAVDDRSAVVSQDADPTQEAAPVALFIGDSYTQGTGASDPLKSWAKVASEALGWSMRNVAAGGTGYVTSLSGGIATVGCGQDTCPDYAQQLEAAADRYAPDVVVIAGGRNDLAKQGIEDAAESLFREARRLFPDAEVVVASPVWDDDPAPADFADVREAVDQAASVTDVTLVEVGEPLEARPELMAADGVHPNNAGHEALAEAFVAAYSG